jgi:hypothetical protein
MRGRVDTEGSSRYLSRVGFWEASSRARKEGLLRRRETPLSERINRNENTCILEEREVESRSSIAVGTDRVNVSAALE